MVQDDLVDLLLVVGRVGQALGHLAVVGEHQHAGGVLVQAADGEDARGTALEDVHHGLFRVRVAGGGDVALGLVHHDVHLLLALETLAVEADVVGEDERWVVAGIAVGNNPRLRIVDSVEHGDEHAVGRVGRQ